MTPCSDYTRWRNDAIPISRGGRSAYRSRYVSEYVFDIGEGFHNTSAVFDYVFGGSAFGLTSPGVSGKLTINGNSVSFTGGYVGQHGYWVGQFSHSVIDDIVGGVWSGMSDVLYFDAPKDLGTSFAATGTGGNGSFHICNWWEGVGCAAEIPALQGITSGDRVSVRAGGVPEPGTWALAILGFGLAGAALRRSRALAQA
ncbi:PEPxxWA-CTERM sorting domain-containing protein [Phenylobacterium sp.]|uniref:PEPxxWA-CTERM sorting domain-containing protein n=1 Tax=Phenylobacterium sp. TaxID=1871053 RepID=UPI002ED84C3D